MKNVKITFRVYRSGSSKTITKKMELDEQDYRYVHSGHTKDCTGWARAFFPSATKVTILSVHEVGSEVPSGGEGIGLWDIFVFLVMLPVKFIKWLVK